MAACGILLSCEHGGYEVPPAYHFLFKGQEEVLNSHRGWDPGTMNLASFLSKEFSAPLVFSTTTRLLIEMNRSLENAQLFSEFSASLPLTEKEKLVNQYYLPYRHAVQQEVELYHRAGKSCLHFSLHSFTPVWQGQERIVDIGLLFDPKRKKESELCYQLRELLQQKLPEMRIFFNEPYLGTDDGLTTYLRTQYDDADYAGIEIEINQKWVGRPEMGLVRRAVKETLHQLNA